MKMISQNLFLVDILIKNYADLISEETYIHPKSDKFKQFGNNSFIDGKKSIE